LSGARPMAATKRNSMLIEEAREKIKTTQLINRLQDHALGENEMSQTQIRATEILLKKRVPDLQAMTLQGSDDGDPVEMLHRIERVIVDSSKA
jgi:hypothetical protein